MFIFFFNDTATTEIYTLSLHDALPIFANTDDNLLGGGSGAAIHQQIRGAGYEAPLPSKVGSLRFMWLTARDIGEATTISFTPTLAPTSGPPLPGPPTSTPLTPAFLPNLSAGDVYGALLGLHLGAAWM